MSHPASHQSSQARGIGKYPTAARVTAHVALARGVAETTAHQELYGDAKRRLNTRAAQAIEGLIRSGDRAALAHFVAPIDAALKGMAAVQDSPKLAEQCDTADADEETAEGRYDRCPCEKHARELVLAYDTERALNLERRTAIAAQWGLV